MGISAKRTRLKMFVRKIPMQEIAERCGCSRQWVEQVINGRYVGPSSREWIEKFAAAMDEILEEREGA